ncbi:MAG: hypothetical protein A3G93_00795 [Nitrospinae bacterium RIFCSPLOWO2_12_FULL_45_22]|nr:MAG: hypothetical protein A3G93_00795 [Nitrospinae bacterium RIFCSPLOWO2_12_FULL_45_22]
MFIDFFYALRQRKVPVSITEWMTLMEALVQGHALSDLQVFYYLARAILIKDEAYFDHYDMAFEEYFRGIKNPEDMIEEILEWSKNLTPEEMTLLKPIGFNRWIEDFEERISNKKIKIKETDSNYPSQTKEKDEGPSSRSAIQIAAERHFKNLRQDLTLDVRQFKVALKHLRQLYRQGPDDELDLAKTIEATSKNAGELELIWRRSKKNAVKLLLLLDVGGSMAPFSRLCSRLFSAAHSATHFKDFRYYYFHNCVYDKVFEDIERQKAFPTPQVLSTLGMDYKLILVGDACMAPEELTRRHGAIYSAEKNEIPGIMWLKRIASHFPHTVWLNPEEPRYWDQPTIRMVKNIFPMYPLTLEGLNLAIKRLARKVNI